jgi:hypothetical protein
MPPSACLGLGLGGPSVVQGPPKASRRVAQGSNCGSALFATRMRKGRAGVGIAVIAVIAEIGKAKTLTTKDTHSTSLTLAQGRLRNAKEDGIRG